MSPIPPPTTTTATTPKTHKDKFPTPLLRLEIRDLAHEGASIFLSHIHGNEDLETQVQNVLNLLYGSPIREQRQTDTAEDDAEEEKEYAPHRRQPTRPGTRSVTFIIHDFSGVAYTTGTDLDKDHKEIHLSADYIVKCARNSDKRHELLGVICHELVHCFQWDASGTCPGGLIEGIADWVRLRAGLGAAHWKQEAGGEWDVGYQKTGYFLDWLEGRFEEGTVRALNGCLRKGKYDEERIFGECCGGKKVADLWREYGEDLRKKKGRDGGEDESGSAIPVPTHPAGKE